MHTKKRPLTIDERISAAPHTRTYLRRIVCIRYGHLERRNAAHPCAETCDEPTCSCHRFEVVVTEQTAWLPQMGVSLGDLRVLSAQPTAGNQSPSQSKTKQLYWHRCVTILLQSLFGAEPEENDCDLGEIDEGTREQRRQTR